MCWNICSWAIRTRKYNMNRDLKIISEGLHTQWPVSVSRKGVLWEHSSNQCESCEWASLRIRVFQNHSSTDLCQYSQWDWLSGPVTDTEDNYRVSLRSLLSPCPVEWKHTAERDARKDGEGTQVTHTHWHQTKDKQFFLLCVSCCCCLCLSTLFPLQFSHFSPYLLHQVCLSVSDMLSVSVKPSPPSARSLSGAPILLIAPFSTLHFCFTSPVSALPLPLVALP